MESIIKNRGVLTGFLCLFLLFILQRFLIAENELGYFIDEVWTIEASTHFFSYGVYSPSENTGYENSVSTGILSTWPAGLGFIFGKSVFWARVGFALQVTLTGLVLVALFFRVRLGKKDFVNWVLASFVFLLSIMSVPYANATWIQVLGEFHAALILGFGFLYLFRTPRLAAFIFGLCIWHTKFIYLPFAVLGLAAAALNAPGTFKNKTGFFITLIGYSLFPIVLWWVVIAATQGWDALILYFKEQWTISYGFFLKYSGVNKDEVAAVSGLFNRLSSSELEWKFYDPKQKFKVIFLLFFPFAAVLWKMISQRAGFFQNLPKAFLQLSTALMLLVFAYWYFFMHRYMHIRHIQPALWVGFAFTIVIVIDFLRKLSPKTRNGLIIAGFSLIILKELASIPKLTKMFASDDYANRISVLCAFDDTLNLKNLDFQKKCEHLKKSEPAQ